MPVREEKVVVKVKAANIRSKPDLNSPVLITVVKGTVLEVQGREDDYYKIIFPSEEKGRIIGYIREDLVESLRKTEIIPETKAAVPEPGKKENIFGRGGKSRLRAVGFRLGFGLANLYGENVQELAEYLEEEMKSRIGANFGLLAIVNLTDQLALQSECAYVSKGAKQSGEVAGEKFTASVILNYLEIPAILRFYFPGGFQFTPSIYAGTYVDLKLSGKVKAQVAEVKTEVDIENLKGSDAGIIIGGGFDFQMPFLP
ncbi:MAG: outer membrane beta-barrel protein [Candidatus Aminicenantales bacterium]